MDQLMGYITILAIFIVTVLIYMKNEEKKAKRRDEEDKIMEELEEAYKNYTNGQIIAEIKKIEKDFNKLEDEAHAIFKRDYPNESVIDILGWDNSTGIMKQLNFPLYAKHDTLISILEKRQCEKFELKAKDVSELSPSDYSIISNLQFKDEDGKEHKIKYTAKIDFNVSGCTNMAFIYSEKLKDKIPELGDYTIVGYNDIKSVEIKDSYLIFKIKNNGYWKEVIPKYLSNDFQEEKDYLIFEMESETPLEIKEIIDQRIKQVQKDME